MAGNGAGNLEEMLVRHLQDIVTLCNRMFEKRHDAEDAAQRATLEALRALPSYDPARPFRPWILKVALNAARDAIRTRVRIARKEKEMPDDVPAPVAKGLEEQERDEVVRRAIAGLPEEIGLPLVLHYFHRLTQSEIAEIADCSQKTVHMRIERGLGMLQQKLAPASMYGVPVLAVLQKGSFDAVPRSLTSLVSAGLACGGSAAAISGGAVAAAAGGTLLKAKLLAGALFLTAASFSAGVAVTGVATEPDARSPAASSSGVEIPEAKGEPALGAAGAALPDGFRDPSDIRNAGELSGPGSAHATAARGLLPAGNRAQDGADRSETKSLDEKLHDAVHRGDLDAISALLVQGADIHSVVRGATPLTVAVQQNHAAAAELLLSRGSRPNDTNDMGWTVLMSAVRLGRDRIAKSLLDHGADVHRTIKDGFWNALALAIEEGNSEMERELRSRGAALAPGKEATIRLLHAAKAGDVTLAGQCISSGADVNAKNYWDYPILTEAAYGKRPEMVRFLIERGAEVNPKEAGYTPLFAAVYDSESAAGEALELRMEVIRILLDAGASMDLPGGYWNHGKTPLEWALENGETGILELFLARGASPDTVLADDTLRSPALVSAASRGNLAMVELLLRHGADPNGRDSNGLTPLAAAESNGFARVAEVIKNAGGK